jgi:hypothetical protein
MVLAGISEKRAMQISGHRTRSVFDRYDITTERDAIETGKQMRRHWEQIAEQEAADAAAQFLKNPSHKHLPSATTNTQLFGVP